MPEAAFVDLPSDNDAGGVDQAKRVLVVEDEAFIAFDLADMLEQLGYEDVVICNSYGSAEQAMQSEEFEIAVFDLNLDGKLSTPLIDRAAAKGMKVVIASGYEVETIPSSDPSTPRIVKPYDIATLRNALAS